jgi:2-hydroxy-3-keto-5-methylthiopentenyl-1-phosphate phosphatase
LEKLKEKIKIDKSEIEQIKWIKEHEVNEYVYFPKCDEKILDGFKKIREIEIIERSTH